MIQRAVPRFVPRLPVTLVLQAPGLGSAFGLIADISTRGACVLTFEDLPVGSTLDCSLNFPNQPEALGLAGKVLWNRKESHIPSRFGMQFDDGCIQGSTVMRLEECIDAIRPL